MLKWETTDKGLTQDERSNRGINPRDPNLEAVTTPIEESSIGTKPDAGNEKEAEPTQAQNPQI